VPTSTTPCGGRPGSRRPLEGPAAGLALLEPLAADPALADYQPLAAARADLLRRAGDGPGAAAAYRQAIALSTNAVEQAELRRRLDDLA
jgi:RNA polymerase sigma-70 factor, ECF subfamily